MQASVKKIMAVLVVCVIVIAPQVFAQTNLNQPLLDEADKFFQAKDWANAAKAYESITQKDPANFQAWNRLGSIYHSSSKYAKAVAAFEKALALNPNGPVVQYNLACAYARLNNNDRAIEVLNRLAPSGFFKPEQISADTDFAGLQNDPRFTEVLAQAQKASRPCTAAPEFRQFDFWIGEWDVVSTVGNQPAGKSSVQLILAECVIFENWTGALGVNGKSFNIYNPAEKKWRQTWVDDRGALTEYTGEYKDDRLEYLADGNGPNGQKQKLRMTFFKQGPDRVRQFGEVSTDDGKTWSTQYDLIYNRRK